MQFGSTNSELVVKSFEQQKILIEGYASVFNTKDHHGDIITKGAFAECKPSLVKLLWQHDACKPIGIIKQLMEDNYGLKMIAEINTSIRLGFEAISLIRQQAVGGLSIGFTINKSSHGQCGSRLITSVNLKEISIVTFPANDNAQIANYQKNFDLADNHICKTSAAINRLANSIKQLKF